MPTYYEYAEGTLFTNDRGYINYARKRIILCTQKDYYARHQFHLVHYRDSIQGIITEDNDRIT